MGQRATVSCCWCLVCEYSLASRDIVLLDGLSLSLATVSALIAWLVIRFRRTIYIGETGFHRFFIILGLFLTGVQLVLLAGAVCWLFVGWEMCAVLLHFTDCLRLAAPRRYR